MKRVFYVCLVARISVLARVRAVFCMRHQNWLRVCLVCAQKTCFCSCVRLCGWIYERFDMYAFALFSARLSEWCSSVRTCIQFDAIRCKNPDKKLFSALTLCFPLACLILRHMSDVSYIQTVIFRDKYIFARLMLPFPTYTSISPYRLMSGHFRTFSNFCKSFIRHLSFSAT